MGALQTTSTTTPARRPEDFPPEVHASLAALRAAAKQAKSWTDVRRATEEEIALATVLQKPWMCIGHSSRTGLPCTKPRITGATVCNRHGAGTKAAKAAITRRLQTIAMPMVARQRELAMQSDNLTVAQKATTDLLDRAGVGEVVQAKVRHSLKDAATTAFDAKIHVSIGLPMQKPGEPPFLDHGNTVVWTDTHAFEQYQAARAAALTAQDAEARALEEGTVIDVTPAAPPILIPSSVEKP